MYSLEISADVGLVVSAGSFINPLSIRGSRKSPMGVPAVLLLGGGA